MSKGIYVEMLGQSWHMFASAMDHFGPKVNVDNIKTVMLAILTSADNGEIVK